MHIGDSGHYLCIMTKSELKRLVKYNPETGEFIHLSGNRKSTIATTHNNYGYIIIFLNGKQYLAHRLAFLYMTGNFPKIHTDHINHIRDDNRFCNLRECTMAQNQHNRPINKNNKTGFKGVSFDKINKRFQSHIKISNKSIRIGYYNTPQEAYIAYCEASAKLHGDFGCLQ